MIEYLIGFVMGYMLNKLVDYLPNVIWKGGK